LGYACSKLYNLHEPEAEESIGLIGATAEFLCLVRLQSSISAARNVRSRPGLATLIPSPELGHTQRQNPAAEDHTLANATLYNAYHRNRERWFRRIVDSKNLPSAPGFFNSYPRFMESSRTATTYNRLNERYRAMIEWNQHLIAGKSVLDIASHDGRFSFAAYKAGAQYVVGIEARPYLVEAARQNIKQYGADERVHFVEGDIMAELDSGGQFDIVLCFGFFYHTLDHMLLLRKIARLNPSHIIMDSSISIQLGAAIEVGAEEIRQESCAAVADRGTPTLALKGTPTKPALELMLKAAGFFDIEYWNWHNAGIKCWNELKDYYLGKRVTLRAKARFSTAALEATA
jgi:2-polyprenyl-3-methyl-5-hydroxy-6-metoxy-1,4-benzoquinol methylase